MLKLVIGDLVPMEVRIVHAEPASAPSEEQLQPPEDLQQPVIEPSPPMETPAVEMLPRKSNWPSSRRRRICRRLIPGRHQADPTASPEAGRQADPAATNGKAGACSPCHAGTAGGSVRCSSGTADGIRNGDLVHHAGQCDVSGPLHRLGQNRTAMVRLLIDVDGRPTQVALHKSSSHAAAPDEEALSAVRKARFKPYAVGGIAQPVWVVIPMKFILEYNFACPAYQPWASAISSRTPTSSRVCCCACWC